MAQFATTEERSSAASLKILATSNQSYTPPVAD
jgi:hypothetical protein